MLRTTDEPGARGGGAALIIENGEVWGPEPQGVRTVFAWEGRIQSLATESPQRLLDELGIPFDSVDARGCLILPGMVDPHEHLIGGSGEHGFASQTPEITLPELVLGGVTTVVGCLGVDTITRTMPALLARAKGFNEEGLSAYIYSGGYDVPPRTLTGSLRGDLLLVPEVIGAGEIAISDRRSSQPRIDELAKVVNDAYVGGILSGKSGVTHIHVGDGRAMLGPLRTLLADYDVRPESLYPTHIERHRALMEEGIELTRAGVTIDLDTEDRDLAKWLMLYFERDGHPDRITASSDAAIFSPATLYEQVRACVLEFGLPLERVLPVVTRNPARVLGLLRKGKIQAGMDADLLVVRANDLSIRDVIARGRVLALDGRLLKRPLAIARGNRGIGYHGA
jgi:beta-aspartyl-dipeptidase (metallo-type)